MGDHGEFLRVLVMADGSLDVRVLVTWPDDPTNEKPAALSRAVKEAIVGVLGDNPAVPRRRDDG
jgi:hypothetical protein